MMGTAIAEGDNKAVEASNLALTNPLIENIDMNTDFSGHFLNQNDYKSNNKVTIILASHNMKEVERLCSNIIMMKKGKIVDRGTCAELIQKHGRENLEDTFLKIARSRNEFE